VTFIPYFHVGFLVDDLDLAMESFGSTFGVTFTVPNLAPVRWWRPDTPEEMLQLKVAYSRQGPPYVELIQSHESGMFASSQGEGFHHIGAWEADCESRQAELIRSGITPVGTQYTEEDKIIVSYFDPEKLHGVMLEIVDEGRKPVMERWWAGDPG
jgi:hypothetical protein